MYYRIIFAVCVPIFASSFVFAQGIQHAPLSLRVYCHVAPFLQEENAKCFGAQASNVVIEDTSAATALANLKNELANLQSQIKSLATTPKAPILIQGIPVQESAIRYVYVKGEKGDTGATGLTQPTSISAAVATAGAFQYIPQPFWNGGGSSGTTGGTVINNTISPLPTGGTLGQVLTINASGTPEWIIPTVSTSSTSTLPTLFANNGLTLSTTSTSTLVELGGVLTKDTTVTQGTQNLRFDRNFASLVNQGATSWPINGFTFTANNFAGLIASTTNTNITAGINDRAGAAFSLYEVSNTQIVGATTNNGALLITPTSAQISFANNQNVSTNVFTDVSGPRLRARNLALGDEASFRLFPNLTTQWRAVSISGFTDISFSSSTGVRFGSNLGAYTFPRVSGVLGEVLTSDGLGNVLWGVGSLATVAQNGLSFSTTSTSTLVQLGGTLIATTTIAQNGFNYESVRVPIVNTNSFFTIENKVRTVPLIPTFLAYNIDHAGAYSEKTYAVPTNIGFGQLALGTVVNRAGLQRGVTEAGAPYFDAYSYIPMSDTTADVHRIYNNNYGPTMYYQKYTSGSIITKRSYMQTRNDGGAYITGSDESLFTRADIDANANGNILLRSVNFPTSNISAQYNSSILGGISLSHASPGFNTTLTLSTTTGVNISNMLAVGTSSPLATLHIATTSASVVARFDNANGYCEINPTSASLICTSDRTLKKNIASLEATTLSKLTHLNPVTYNWLREADGATPQYGFIAQDVESIFPTLVYTNESTGIKTLSYTSLIPITIQSLKDLNLALGDFTATSSTPESFADSSIFKKILAGLEWMGVKIERGIASFKTIKTETLCVGDTCVTEAELKQLLQNTQVQGGVVPPSPIIVPDATTSTTTIVIPPTPDTIPPTSDTDPVISSTTNE